jgi:hypothetical protein
MKVRDAEFVEDLDLREELDREIDEEFELEKEPTGEEFRRPVLATLQSFAGKFRRLASRMQRRA